MRYVAVLLASAPASVLRRSGPWPWTPFFLSSSTEETTSASRVRSAFGTNPEAPRARATFGAAGSELPDTKTKGVPGHSAWAIASADSPSNPGTFESERMTSGERPSAWRNATSLSTRSDEQARPACFSIRQDDSAAAASSSITSTRIISVPLLHVHEKRLHALHVHESP